MLNVDDYLSQWLTPDSVPSGGIDTQVLSVQVTNVGGQQGEGKPKLVLHVRNLKPIILNKASGKNLSDAWGKDAEKWVGRPLHVDTMMSQQFGQYVPMIILSPVAAKGKRPSAARPPVKAPKPLTAGTPDVDPDTGEILNEPAE